MKIKVRVIETVLAILIAIPLIMTKVKSMQPTPEKWVHAPLECEVESMIEANNKEEPETETQIEIVELENFAEIETTEIQFVGYSFIPLSAEEQRTIKQICDKNELSYELMLGVAKQESRYDMSCHNPVSDDWGLFQINEKTWNDKAIELGLTDYRTDIAQNTELACYIVNYCLGLANGDLRVALNYYRTGTPNPKYEAGSDYATIIMNNIKEITANPNKWTLEELEIMHRVMGAEFELNNGKITKYEVKGE